MKFREKLQSGKFVITCEVPPPKGTDTSYSLENASFIRELADAVNVTDNQCAQLHMSSIAFSTLLKQNGYEPIMQMTCRDRNRIGIQSDVLGAYGLGIRNILIMSGDYPTFGNQPGAKPVYDLDSVHALNAISLLKKGTSLSGSNIAGPFDMCVGAVCNPVPEKKFQIMKLEKKVKAGAEFIQTQAVFDVDMFSEFMDLIRDRGIDIPILSGIVPLRSVEMARYMNQNIPGISVPPEIIKRMEYADDQIEEGIEITAEIIKCMKNISNGIHIMPIKSHRCTKNLLRRSNFL